MCMYSSGCLRAIAQPGRVMGVVPVCDGDESGDAAGFGIWCSPGANQVASRHLDAQNAWRSH